MLTVAVRVSVVGHAPLAPIRLVKSLKCRYLAFGRRVVAVLMHPTLTRRSVQLLTCDLMEGKMYLRRDLEVACWEGAHVAWALTIGLPFLIVYAFGIPLYVV